MEENEETHNMNTNMKVNEKWPVQLGIMHSGHHTSMPPSSQENMLWKITRKSNKNHEPKNTWRQKHEKTKSRNTSQHTHKCHQMFTNQLTTTQFPMFQLHKLYNYNVIAHKHKHMPKNNVKLIRNAQTSNQHEDKWPISKIPICLPMCMTEIERWNRHTHTHTYKHTEKTQTHTDKHTEKTQTHTNKHTQTQTNTHTNTDKHRQTHNTHAHNTPTTHMNFRNDFINHYTRNKHSTTPTQTRQKMINRTKKIYERRETPNVNDTHKMHRHNHHTNV